MPCRWLAVWSRKACWPISALGPEVIVFGRPFGASLAVPQYAELAVENAVLSQFELLMLASHGTMRRK